MMVAAPTLADVQLRVRALSESITERDAGSVEALETSLQQLNACAGEVSKLLDAAKQARKEAELAKEKARKAAEKAKQAQLAKKEQFAKEIRDQIAALTARLNAVEAEVISVSPVQDVAEAQPSAVSPAPSAAAVIAAPPPFKARKSVGRGVSPKPAGRGVSPKPAGRGVSPKSVAAASPRDAMPPPKPAAPVKRACEDVPADTKRRKTIPKVPPPAAAAAADVPRPPAAAAAADVPPPAAAAAAVDPAGNGAVQCTQEVDWETFSVIQRP